MINERINGKSSPPPLNYNNELRHAPHSIKWMLPWSNWKASVSSQHWYSFQESFSNKWVTSPLRRWWLQFAGKRNFSFKIPLIAFFQKTLEYDILTSGDMHIHQCFKYSNIIYKPTLTATFLKENYFLILADDLNIIVILQHETCLILWIMQETNALSLLTKFNW